MLQITKAIGGQEAAYEAFSMFHYANGKRVQETKNKMIHLALYQPDIPQNVGSLIRLAACFEATLHIIEPCGFAFDERRLKRVAMDYMEHARVERHLSWNAFLEWKNGHPGNPRLILLTTKASVDLYQFTFQSNDILLLGRESSGVPKGVSDACDARLRIPISPQARSLNIAQAAAIALGETVRQTGTRHVP